jgi:hypothetical protein
MAHTIPTKIISGGSIDLLRSHVNAPVRSTAPGTTISLLDACLLDGFGEVVLTSLTIDSSGTATATSTSHGYTKIHTVILISGADQEDINGEWSITAIPDADHVQFDATDSGLTSTTITGATITMKVAPLGWAKPFSDAPNFVSVYQSLNPLSRRNMLRVDDQDNLASNDVGATYFRGYEYMSSAQDTGAYAFPPKSSLTRGVSLRKNLNTTPGVYCTTSAANISWTIVGNSNQFYFSTHAMNGSDKKMRVVVFFGDMISYVPGDVGASCLCGDGDAPVTTVAPTGISYINSYTNNYCPRNSKRTHTVSQQRFKLWNYPTISTASQFLGSNNSIDEPDITSNRTIIFRPFLISDENNVTSIRGEMPGMAIVLNNFLGLSVLYEPGEVVVIGNERFVYMPLFTWPGTSGFFLLTLDKDWNTPILQ